jgi:hypothetical protein
MWGGAKAPHGRYTSSAATSCQVRAGSMDVHTDQPEPPGYLCAQQGMKMAPGEFSQEALRAESLMLIVVRQGLDAGNAVPDSFTSTGLVETGL